jgi:hypothetical protein
MTQPDRPPVTYILPSTEWACLLDIIVRDAPPGAVIEVHTEAMYVLSEAALQQIGRQDVTVRRGRRQAAEAA